MGGNWNAFLVCGISYEDCKQHRGQVEKNNPSLLSFSTGALKGSCDGIVARPE